MYSLEFENQYDWVKISDSGALQAYCIVCFSVSHDSLNDVKRHSKGKKKNIMNCIGQEKKYDELLCHQNRQTLIKR